MHLARVKESKAGKKRLLSGENGGLRHSGQVTVSQ